MTAEENQSGNGDGGMSTECSSTTPHLGSNDSTTNDRLDQESHTESRSNANSSDHKESRGGGEDYLSSSSSVITIV